MKSKTIHRTTRSKNTAKNSPFLGSYLWATHSNGRLTRKEKFTLMHQALPTAMKQFLGTVLHLDQPKIELALTQIALPDTRFVKEAIAELEQCAAPSLIAHSWRTYYWGAALGLLDNMAFDPELLLIGCLLHDLGLTDSHAAKSCDCFALAGAEAAKIWSQKVNYPADKAETVADMICLHMNGHLDNSRRIESRLLQQGAACDVIGSRFYQLNVNYRNAVLQQQPRQDFNRQFSQLMAQEAARHPQSRTALMQQLGLPLMIRLNPFKD